MTEDAFGPHLRRERERRQIQLASIAATTKINVALFEGLERDDVSRWPSGIFRRSFIRAYAQAVGLDVEATARKFLERFPDPLDDTPRPTASPIASSGAPAPSPGRPPAPAEEDGLRLTLADTSAPFSGGRVVAAFRQRWTAVAWDVGVVTTVALVLFVALDTFWMPLGLSTILYYVGGILVLGNTPGVFLFAPAARPEAPTDEDAQPSRPHKVRGEILGGFDERRGKKLRVGRPGLDAADRTRPHRAAR